MPLRSLALAGIVVGVAGCAIVNPLIGLFGYVWFALMRPDYLAWSYGDYPYSIILAVATSIGTIRYLPRITVFFRNPIILLVLGLQIPFILSALFAVDASIAIPPLINYLKVIAVYTMIPLLLTGVEHHRRMLLVMVASLGLIALKFSLFGLRAGGVQFNVGYAGFFGDTNGLALALTMLLPLCWGAISLSPSKWIKHGISILALASIATTVMTYSRGGAIALFVVSLLLVYRSRHRILLFIGVFLVLVPSVLWMSQSYLERVESIRTYETDASALNRLEYWSAGLAMAKDHPVAGVGFGTYNQIQQIPPYLGRYSDQVLHNTYLQVLVDSGVVAFALYLLSLFGTIFLMGKSASRLHGTNPELAAYPRAIQISLIGFAVGSLFYSRIGFELMYILLMCSASWYELEHSTLTATLGSSEPQTANFLVPAPAAGDVPIGRQSLSKERLPMGTPGPRSRLPMPGALRSERFPSAPTRSRNQ